MACSLEISFAVGGCRTKSHDGFDLVVPFASGVERVGDCAAVPMGS